MLARLHVIRKGLHFFRTVSHGSAQHEIGHQLDTNYFLGRSTSERFYLHWVAGTVFLDLEPEEIMDRSESLRIGRGDPHTSARLHLLILIDDTRLHSFHHVRARRLLGM